MGGYKTKRKKEGRRGLWMLKFNTGRPQHQPASKHTLAHTHTKHEEEKEKEEAAAAVGMRYRKGEVGWVGGWVEHGHRHRDLRKERKVWLLKAAFQQSTASKHTPATHKREGRRWGWGGGH